MTGSGNNTWLLDGDEPTLIDAGVGATPHVEAIAARLGGRDLARVLVTHGHADHASGAPALQARWPRVEIWKHSPERGEGWRELVDGQRVRAGDHELTVIHTPGHAIDHVCFWNSATRDLFAGDMLALGTTVMIPAEPGRRAARVHGITGTTREPRPEARVSRSRSDHRSTGRSHRRSTWPTAECVRSRFANVSPRALPIRQRLSRVCIRNCPQPCRPAARATIEAHIEKLREDGL